MKKVLLLVTLLIAGKAYGETRWTQPDNEKPKQAFDYFIGGEDEITYVQLSSDAKAALKKMLYNAQENATLGDVINNVKGKIKTPAGKEAFNALKEMAAKDDELPVAVVKDGIFEGGKKMKEGKAQAQQARS